jgi:MFS family permease
MAISIEADRGTQLSYSDAGEARWRQHIALAVMLCGGIATTLTFSAVVPGLPRIADQFKGGDSVLGAQFVLTLAPIGMAAAGLFTGRIISRLGTRGGLFAGLVLASACGLAQLFINSFYFLLASRFLLGCSVVTVDTILSAMFAVRYAGPARARLLGFRQAISSTGSVGSMLLAGYLVQTGGWHAAAWMYLILPVILVFAVIAFNKPVETADRQIGERTLERFSVFQLWPIYLLSFLMTIAHSMPAFQLPFLLRENGVTSAVLVSRVPALSSFVGVLAAIAFGTIYSRIGRGALVLISVFMGTGFIGIGLAPTYSLILACIVLEGVGAGMGQPYFVSRALDRVTPLQRSSAVGLIFSSVFIGHFFNPIVIAPLRAAFGIHAAFIIMGSLLWIAALFLGWRAISTRGTEKII